MTMQRPDELFLKRVFDYYFEAPLSVWATITPHLEHRTYKKNKVIKEAGQTEHNIDIIIKGSIGVFFWTDNHPRCIDLFYEDYFSCDYMSYIEAKPSELFVQVLETTDVFSISRTKIQELSEESLMGNKIIRAAAQSLFLHKQRQQIEMLTLTAEERYKKMLKEQPDRIHRTASKHIASYLGITPESLSRIRNKVS